MQEPRRNWKPVVAALCALIVAIAAVLGLTGGDDSSNEPPTPTVVHVDGADADTKKDDTLPLDKSAQEGLDRIENGDTAKELQKPLNAGDKPQPLDGPLAAQEATGCRTAFVVNQSSRHGSRVRIIVWHQTVSRENGASSQNALTAMANRPSSGVSWHKLIGRSDGLCTYTVPLTMKAWTQGNANPFSIGYEIEAYGDEGTYVTGAGKRQLLRQTVNDAKRFGIPIQRGLVQNCVVLRPGIVEHSDLGQCGGGHVDVTLTTNVQTNALIAEARRLSQPPKPRSAAQRRACRSLAYHRTRVRRGASWQDLVTNRQKKRVKRYVYANAQKRTLKRAHVNDRRYCNGSR